MTITKKLNFDNEFPYQQLNISTENISFDDIKRVRINYINNEDGLRILTHEKINVLFNNILPKFGLTEEDIIYHIISKEVINILPNVGSIPLPNILKSIQNIKEYIDKVNSEKLTIQKVRDEFSYLNTELTDTEIMELHKFISTFK